MSTTPDPEADMTPDLHAMLSAEILAAIRRRNSPISVLPTAPGSVAWTQDGGISVLTGDGVWFAAVRSHKKEYLSADEVLDDGVIRVFDASKDATP